jgi:hypothetical protein
MYRTIIPLLIAGIALSCERSEGPGASGAECPPNVVPAPLSREPSPLLDPQADAECRLLADGRLTAACLPRCSAHLRPGFYACRELGCEDAELASDATAAIAMTAASGVSSLDCAGCVRRARSLCSERACPREWAARAACTEASTRDCSAEANASGACFFARQELYEPCWFLAVDSCFEEP